MADFETALLFMRLDVARMPHDHPARAAYLSQLGYTLGKKYAHTGAIQDLEEAIQISRQAVEATPHDDPNRANRLNNLGNRLESWYGRTGDLMHLEEAIQAAREGLQLTPEDQPDRSVWLANLANKLQDRYSRTGEAADLEEAIRLAKQAVDGMLESDSDRGVWLNNLGNTLFLRYSRTGDMADLEAAIQVARDAVEATKENHEEQAAKLNNLGVMIDRRYTITGEITDLEEAIRVARQAVALQPNYPDWLTNLGTKLERRYDRMGNITDLDEAIRLARQAVDLTPRNHPSRPIYLNNLGHRVRTLYERTRKVEDIEEAVHMMRQAVDLTPYNHPDRPARLSNLGTQLHARSSRMGTTADLDEAIGLAKQAVHSTPDDHPDRAGRLNNLASMLGSRYDLTRMISDLQEASQLRQKAWDCKMATPFQRIEAAARGMKLLALIDQVNDAIQLGKDVIELLPTVNTRLLNRDDQQFVVAKFVGIANDLCAFLLESGQTEDALQYLEKGRAVVLGRIVDSRSDISDLSRQHPEIALQYEYLLDQVNAPLATLKPGPTKAHTLKQRDEALAKLDACIGSIRALPKYERFLLGPTTAKILECAAEGTLVVVNVSFHRCDAIIIEGHQIRQIALAHLKLKDINENGRNARLDSPLVLRWLWDVVASPVLNALGFTKLPPNDNWSHIWWIPTGPLSKFPIHAAGYHTIGSTESVLDRVISSYSSSIKATIHNHQHRVSNTTVLGMNRALLVAMPETPQQSKLPFADKEIAMLRSICMSMGLDPFEPGKRMQNIISHLPGCKIFHFAGHGHTDILDPLQSHLLLEDWQSDRLTVTTLLEMNLRKHSPFLAYLSACGTGQIKDEKFIDESIHLISACQLAGFRHVIGTLWEVNDEFCVDMARIMYQVMRDGGMTDESVSRGLHMATRELRDQCIRLSPMTQSKGKQVGNFDMKGVDDKIGALSVNDGDHKDVKLPRDAVICDDEDNEDGDAINTRLSHWVPYVHFGA